MEEKEKGIKDCFEERNTNEFCLFASSWLFRQDKHERPSKAQLNCYPLPEIVTQTVERKHKVDRTMWSNKEKINLFMRNPLCEDLNCSKDVQAPDYLCRTMMFKVPIVTE